MTVVVSCLVVGSVDPTQQYGTVPCSAPFGSETNFSACFEITNQNPLAWPGAMYCIVLASTLDFMQRDPDTAGALVCSAETGSAARILNTLTC
jgi:hypothetical protein